MAGTDDSKHRRTESRDYTLPDGVPDRLRRRLLSAAGAGGLAALAGCAELLDAGGEFESVSDQEEYLDYTELDYMAVDWIPEELVVPLETQIAYSEAEIRFRFEFDSPYPYGWYHDMLVYDDGEWRELDAPNPDVADPDYGATEWHEGFTEEAAVSIWEFHDYVLEDPERFAQRNVDLELDEAPRE